MHMPIPKNVARSYFSPLLLKFSKQFEGYIEVLKILSLRDFSSQRDNLAYSLEQFRLSFCFYIR